MAASASAAKKLSTSLEGRVAIVTGGTGGIGSAVASHLASLGANVVIGYIGDPTLAEHLLSTINAAATTIPRAIAVEADVSDPAQVKALFDRAESAFGKINILVTTAAVIDDTYPTLADTSDEKWDWVFSVNAKGTFLCCREAANRIVRGGGGRIITFSSSTVGSLRLGYGAYAATKGAVETMTKVLARELKGTMITANAIAPGPTTTPMFYAGKTEKDVEDIRRESPLERIGCPMDVAPLVGFLASDAGGWVNAQVIRCNGGYV
ncbi:short-chain type dehydrogenase/reductase-like protein [Cinnamomum micranthum f. kanehirae]|uniref:Short-chain type dehydrogenase/reductase-like protein n=1 Tax=Cinnamomum micranthum f. kanehirae TaxID=337451 RepID=A0A3S3QJH6_9MAGN|nr:short-chain type dehydrogenase/reductase-like protein [Cinnamomum micranthum f. kanehirae]